MSKLVKVIGVKDQTGKQYSTVKIVDNLSNNTEIGQAYAFVNRRNHGAMEQLMEIVTCPFIVKDDVAYINRHTVNRITSLHDDI